MKEKRTRRWWLLGLPAIMALLTLAAIAAAPYLRPPGIGVTIRNAGDKPIQSIVLHVTGASYSLGDIAPGASGTATINSTGESSLVVEMTDGDGSRHRRDADVYLEPGYRGTIRLTIRDGTIERNERQVRF